MLDGRYRIMGLLGRGGMGEVYRADDLRLGQPVALKLLPRELGSDPGRLAKLHNEVRTARQVSHANVCRVYDIGETEGLVYLSMEYVDGEDLATSLRRIGRFPEDRAVEIARQICAGLAAAHERGILHRDLKPANIMLDGSGKVRLMDFGLASIGDVGEIREGTPAYMAPEQLSGQGVTVQSDVYALGLVLYEIFTGRRAYSATTLDALQEQHRTGAISAPADIVKTIDPAIERAILRCLDPDPSRRPSSALAVSASLPGGDPLAAALAAGETPSPEMVAAAGGEGAVMSMRAALTWLVIGAMGLAATLWLADRTSILARVPLTKPPAVLSERAEQIRHALGYTNPVVDEKVGFAADDPYLEWAAKEGAGHDRWNVLRAGRPAALRFWRRTSPRNLIPVDFSGPVNLVDPPTTLAGMTTMELDPLGRLIAFDAAPPEREETPGPASPTDWGPVFTAAGLPLAAFSETVSTRTPPRYVDERRAWQGVLPDTSTTVRIEAAAYRGRPVWFAIVGPWTPALREPDTTLPKSGVGPLQPIIIILLITGAAWLARRNVRSGRADRRGAFRLAAFSSLLIVAQWLLSSHLASVNEERRYLFTTLGFALLLGGILYIIYLALEPFVRKTWPTMLVGWSRVVSGRIRDPLVGRDVLIGIACGAGLAAVEFAYQLFVPVFGGPEPIPYEPNLGPLLGIRNFIISLLNMITLGLQGGLVVALEFALFRGLVQRAGRRLGVERADHVAVAAAVVLVTLITLAESSDAERWPSAIYQAVTVTVILLVLLRVGLLATTVMLVTTAVTFLPLTLDGSRFYAGSGWFAVALIAAVAVGALRYAASLHSEPSPRRTSTMRSPSS